MLRGPLLGALVALLSLICIQVIALPVKDAAQDSHPDALLAVREVKDISEYSVLKTDHVI
jgi:hypothetical protein